MQKMCSKFMKKLKHWKVDVGKTLGGRDKAIVFSSTRGKKRRIALSLSDDSVHILTERKALTINLESGLTTRIRTGGKDVDKIMRLFAYDPGAKEIVFEVDSFLARHALIRYMMDGDWIWGTIGSEANEEGFCTLNLFRITPGYHGGNDIGYGIHNFTAFEDEVEFLADVDNFVHGDFITDIGTGRRYVCLQENSDSEDLRYYKVTGMTRSSEAKRLTFMIKTGVIPIPWLIPANTSSLVRRNLTRIYHIPSEKLQLTTNNFSNSSMSDALATFSDYYTVGVTWHIVEDEIEGGYKVVGRERRH